MIEVKPDVAAARSFFGELFGAADRGFLAIFSLPGEHTTWIELPNLDAATATVIATTNQGCNAYFGVGLHPADLGGRKRGTAAGVIAIPGLYMDIDLRDDVAHKETRLPGSIREEIGRLAETVPLPPTLLVDSGHGLHAYWLLKDVWYFATDEERRRAAQYNRTLQRLVKQAATTRGWAFDTTADLARVLRVPGSINRKTGLPPVPVRVIQDGGPRYTVEVFEASLLLNESPSSATSTSTGLTAPVARFDRIVAGCGFMRHWRDDAAMLTEPEWNAGMTIVGRCVDGEQVAHHHSAPYSGYDYDQTQQKFAYARDGDKPCTCATIRSERGGESFCATCIHWGTISSPIMLGYPPGFRRKPSETKTEPPPPADDVPPIGSGAVAESTGQGGDNPPEILTNHDAPGASDDGDALELRLRNRAQRAPDDFVGDTLGDAAIVTALARRAQDDDVWWQWLIADLRKIGVKRVDLNRLEKTINKLVRDASKDAKKQGFRVIGEHERPVLARIKTTIPSAPVGDDAVVPPGYRLGMSGVFVEHQSEDSSSLVPIATSPVVITGRTISRTDRSESLVLAWPRDGQWRDRIVPRATVMNARDLTSLAGYGAPVTSRTASDLVGYLSAHESANAPVIKRAEVSDHLGWQGNEGDRGFLWGRTIIHPDGTGAEEINVEEAPPDDWREDWISFKGSSEGDGQIVSAFHARGDFDGWKRAIATIVPYPRVLLAVYAALAAPLLMILKVPTFIVDWCGFTTQGKTTTLGVGVSVWGFPLSVPQESGSVMMTWNVTRVYAERRAALTADLPLVLDDTKQAPKPEFVAQLLYDLSNNQGRGRGSIQGVRRSASWRTAVLSSGEAPAVSFTQDGGTRARTATLWGSPFGVVDSGTARPVNCLQADLGEHYGHAGPEFVSALLANRNHWDDWRQAYRNTLNSYIDRAGDNAVAGRLAKFFAAIDLAALLFHDRLALPWEYRDPIDPLWGILTAEALEADRATAALAATYAWAKANEFAFEQRHNVDRDGDVKLPAGGWIGRWEQSAGWSTIAMLAPPLRRFLESQTFDVDAVLRLWRDRGWLETTSDDRKRHEKRIRLNGDLVWAVVIRREAIETLHGAGGDADEAL